jgi:hypothetical protein
VSKANDEGVTDCLHGGGMYIMFDKMIKEAIARAGMLYNANYEVYSYGLCGYEKDASDTRHALSYDDYWSYCLCRVTAKQKMSKLNHLFSKPYKVKVV